MKWEIEDVMTQLTPIMQMIGTSEAKISHAKNTVVFTIGPDKDLNVSFSYAILGLCLRLVKVTKDLHLFSCMRDAELRERIEKLEELNRIIPLENKKALSPPPPPAPK